MGLEAGFDLSPPLENTEADNKRWNAFLSEIRRACVYHRFRMKEHARGIWFHVGECPFLPNRGYLFRRFSSEVSRDNIADDVIFWVLKIAERHFGVQRIHYWLDSAGKPGPHDWLEVVRVQGHHIDDVSEVEKEMNLKKGTMKAELETGHPPVLGFLYALWFALPPKSLFPLCASSCLRAPCVTVLACLCVCVNGSQKPISCTCV